MNQIFLFLNKNSKVLLTWDVRNYHVPFGWFRFRIKVKILIQWNGFSIFLTKIVEDNRFVIKLLLNHLMEHLKSTALKVFGVSGSTISINTKIF